MNKLAPYNRLVRIAIPAVLLAILLGITYQVTVGSPSPIALTVSGVIALVLVVMIIKGYRSRDIYYDKETMFLKGNDVIAAVHFSKIKRVKLSLSDARVAGMKFYLYRIEYLNESGELAEIQFWTSGIGSEMEEFEKEVKAINPYVKVEHWAVS